MKTRTINNTPAKTAAPTMTQQQQLGKTGIGTTIGTTRGTTTTNYNITNNNNYNQTTPRGEG